MTGTLKSTEPTRVAGEPQPVSRTFKTRKGAANLAAREQSYSDRIEDGLRWEPFEVDGGWMVFVTDTADES